MYNRAWVVSLGCLIWGGSTLAFSFATTVGHGIATWAVTGLGLCLVIPNVQSMTADYFEENDRGKAFGVLYLTSAGGAALGTLWATNIGRTPNLPALSLLPCFV
jgi:MFS family permease